MAILLLLMFSPTRSKSKCLSALLEMTYFYDLAEPRAFGIPNQILQGTGTELPKSHKTATVLGKSGGMGSVILG
jgi:hypothetical protein